MNAPVSGPTGSRLFDRRTRLLLTGDTLYPGRIYVRSVHFTDLRQSVDRVVEFTKDKKVAWILGAHIEMTTTPGRDFDPGTKKHPNEHRLELPYAALLQLQATLRRLGTRPQRVVHDDFILEPRP